MGCRPEPTFFVALSEARGSLGAYALREDFTMRCPERSERCLANARQDKKGSLAGRSRGSFLKSPLPLLTKFKFLLCNLFNESNF
jgi:hypothetical protein